MALTIPISGGTASVKTTLDGSDNVPHHRVDLVIPGTASTNLGKAEDSPHTSGDTGVMAMGVRRDANTALVGTDGDYAPYQVNAVGAVKVVDVDSVPLSGLVNGSVANTDGALTAVIAAQGSGVVTYLTDFTIQNSSGAGVLVEIKDGSTTKWRVYAGADGGGATHKFSSPIPGTANTAWNIDAGAATSTIYASFAGFKV